MRYINPILLSASCLFIVFIKACTCSDTSISIQKEHVGLSPDSVDIYLYTLTNNAGMIMKVTNYGGIITSLKVPDKNRNLTDVVLGFDSIKDYYKKSPYFGALIGRYGNRIANARFSIYGKEYSLAGNNGNNHLHGGIKGFDKVVWDATEFANDSAVGLVLHYLSQDGEEGYPGNLDINVTYTLTNHNELIFTYHAVTDKATPVNLTQHSYFNLEGKGDIKSHEMMIAAAEYTVVDSSLIPTGEIRSVEGTPFDFRQPKPIGQDLEATGGNPIGYDHNFVLGTNGIHACAVRVRAPGSGIVMEVFTDQPGVQFYSGNFLDGNLLGKKGNPYQQYSGFCIETQHFPDSPNQPSFPNTILRPGEVYQSISIYRFGL